MKKLKVLILILAVCFMAASSVCAANSSVVQTIAKRGTESAIVTFVCTGDDGTGAIANTGMEAGLYTYLKGWYLYKVEVFPTSGGTAPDAADLMIYDSDGLDLLGSEDGGTTAYAGLGMIHATLKRTCLPNLYLPRAGLHVNYYPVLKSTLTVDVDNQATASANYTIILTFVK